MTSDPTSIFQLAASEYLETELHIDGQSDMYVPDEWWLSDAPLLLWPRVDLYAARKASKVPDFYCHGMLTFVSTPMKDALQQLGGFDGEFHPVAFHLKRGRASEAAAYWCFRLFTELPALDRDASDIEYFPDTDRPKRVWSLRLHPVDPAINVFRIEKMTPAFVSHRAAAVLRSLHVSLRPTEEFRLGC